VVYQLFQQLMALRLIIRVSKYFFKIQRSKTLELWWTERKTFGS
jgi:hypothetical protein